MKTKLTSAIEVPMSDGHTHWATALEPYVTTLFDGTPYLKYHKCEKCDESMVPQCQSATPEGLIASSQCKCGSAVITIAGTQEFTEFMNQQLQEAMS